MDKLLTMHVFTRIVQTGSLKRAADATGLSSPRVSSLLTSLEEHLGCRLLSRSTRKLSLTEDGQAYYERCIAVLADIEDMEASVAHARNAPRGRVKAYLPPFMAKEIVIPALPAFLAEHPNIAVELGVTDRQIDIVGDGVDCIVRVGALNDSELIAKRIGSLAHSTCAAPDYFERRGVPETVEDLAQHIGVCYRSADTGRPRPWEFVADGAPRVVQMLASVSVNDADSYIACGIAGLGLIHTALYFVKPFLESGRLREVLIENNPPPRAISILYPSNRHLPAKLKVFIDWLAGLFAQNPVLQGQRG